MKFVPQSLIELARGNRLFVGAVEAGTPKVGYELASASYVFTKVSAGDVVEALPRVYVVEFPFIFVVVFP
jgi:hypothetical protein